MGRYKVMARKELKARELAHLVPAMLLKDSLSELDCIAMGFGILGTSGLF